MRWNPGMTETDLVTRPPGEPAPDLTDYRVVHRAMAIDLARLTRAAAELVDRPDRARMAALRYYLRAVSGEIESHHHVEDEHVWPFLVTVAGKQAALVPLTGDHDRLDPLLQRVAALGALELSSPALVGALDELTELLVRHIADEERDVFPMIERFVRPADYRRLQKRFQANLRLSLMPFLLPWVLRHASASERRMLLAHAGWPARVLLRIFEPGFRAREELVFG
jgi:iron-sulfur cluster repair protein YtfE (RIC family)